MATYLDQELADGIRNTIDTFISSRRRFGVQSIPIITAVINLKKANAPDNVVSFFDTVRTNVLAFENALDAVEMQYQAVFNRADQSVADSDLRDMLAIGDNLIEAHNSNLVHLKENMGDIVALLDDEMDDLLGADDNTALINAIGNTTSFGDWFGSSIHMLMSIASVVAQGDNTVTQAENQIPEDPEDIEHLLIDDEDIANILRAGLGGGMGNA